MFRPELHSRRQTPDFLSRPPARPCLDAVAWNAERALLEQKLDAAIAELRAAFADAELEAKAGVRNDQAA